ncbi:hypothetical protein IW492_07315 [Enterococcus sp. BWB1-3]|uniref:hypothetical protein n=1 Tax=unclassified Enterococcus TaxID=2608891 RepID=UPI001920BA7B|nr:MULTISPECIES: hypothetical protein [unclassified Enterococcus]MBL1229042.1 hypothetical protein [Enterococcus sp. BWB1-3]MCB5952311.1 hypothetical protein [Enterococcus sp. BWT-B8]
MKYKLKFNENRQSTAMVRSYCALSEEVLIFLNFSFFVLLEREIILGMLERQDKKIGLRLKLSTFNTVEKVGDRQLIETLLALTFE